jgi:hypothetical protein
MIRIAVLAICLIGSVCAALWIRDKWIRTLVVVILSFGSVYAGIIIGIHYGIKIGHAHGVNSVNQEFRELRRTDQH